MVDRSVITPEIRKTAESGSQAVAAFIADLSKRLAGGAKPDWRLAMYLVQALPALLAQTQASLAAGAAGQAALAGEILDALTGTDANALGFADDDTFKYMTAAENEAFFDSFKAHVEQGVLQAAATRQPK